MTKEQTVLIDGIEYTLKQAMSKLCEYFLMKVHEVEDMFETEITGTQLTATCHDGSEMLLTLKRIKKPNEQLSSQSLGGNMTTENTVVTPVVAQAAPAGSASAPKKAKKKVAKKKTAKKAKKKVAKKAKKKTAKKAAKK